ncbi:hypothetical protein BX600DRAFT_452985 [Xylariales sp. PMI_506]|nr:hypothetical protein BX600DRAFT_452985 [Xylariales sp. PMI_506]
MASKQTEELFIALLRSAYSNTCHNAVKHQSQAIAPKLSAVGAAAYLRPLYPPQLQRRAACLYLGGCRGYATTRSAGSRSPAARSAVPTSRHVSPPPQNKRQIAVLGGGITGLTATHYLARHAPDAHITLYEATDRLGGWIDGKYTKTGEDGLEVLMQRGPRMLRPGGTTNKYDDLVFYDVLANLKLQDKLMYAGGAEAARYIYYPDHLVKLPQPSASISSIFGLIHSLLTEKIWTGTFNAYLNWANHFNRSNERVEMKRQGITPRTELDKDESVAGFLGRVFQNKDAAPINNLVSAMLHGIHGGDVHKLSAKHTMFDRFWWQSAYPNHEGYMWVCKKEANLMYDILDGPNRRVVVDMAEDAAGRSLMVFQDGLTTLADGIVADLKEQPNVTIKTEAPVTELKYEEGKVVVRSRPLPAMNQQIFEVPLSTNILNQVSDGAGGKDVAYDQVLSTLFSGQLARISQPVGSLPSLEATEAATIMVVNLWYPNPYLLENNPGFGYLIPQSVPPEENPECALGVLFDSDLNVRDEPGTKVTVMLGGHYWNEWPVLPTEEMGVDMAKAVVERHLGISPEEKVVTGAKLCRDSIPQHNVGHNDRMRSAHYELLSTFGGKLTVAGPSYTTIGVIPAMRAGFDAGMRIARGGPSPWFHHEDRITSLWKNVEASAKSLGVEFKVMDHVGLTGLEWATESDFDRMSAMRYEDMWFKKWTRADLQFSEQEARWKKYSEERNQQELD